MDYFALRNSAAFELRRSLRLAASGYYGADGSPTINYKERLFRVFKRRRGLKKPLTSGCCSWDALPPLQRENQIPRVPLFPFLIIPMMIVSLTLFQTFAPAHLVFWREGPHRSAIQASSMENYAVQSKQATVLRSHSTDTYCNDRLVEWLWGWLRNKHLWMLHSDSPLHVGHCWPFKGDKGQLHVQLSQSIHITHITLGHITLMQSPTGETSSAPKHFSVYGMKTPDGDEKLLGQFIYQNQGSSLQMFALPEQNEEGFAHVRLKVETNWGNTEYTCVYNFRVHGTPSE